MGLKEAFRKVGQAIEETKMQKSEKSKIFQHMKTENSILRLKCRLNRRKWKK